MTKQPTPAEIRKLRWYWYGIIGTCKLLRKRLHNANDQYFHDGKAIPSKTRLVIATLCVAILDLENHLAGSMKRDG